MRLKTWFLITILTVAIPVGAQDDEPIRIETRLVIVPFTAIDRNRKPVQKLSKSEVGVFENGKPQVLSFLETGEDPFAAVVLIDTSGSMEDRILFARSAAITFLAGIRDVDSVAILQFDNKVQKLRDFSNSGDVPERFFDLSAKGYTALNDAIAEAARMLSQRDERRRAIIVLSDGADTRSSNSGESALRAALAADATIYTVDMNPPDQQLGSKERLQNHAVLRNFANRTGGIFVNAPGGTVMRDALEQIVGELKTQNLIGYESSDPRKDGRWRSIEIRVSRPEVSVRSRRGYFAPR
jgi:Ca-activated chloride channel family protein